MGNNGQAAAAAAVAADALRLDKWFWHARFFKSRSLASKFCQSGKARVNGDTIRKAHYMVRCGDTLTFPIGTNVRVVKIVALGSRRGPAPEAQGLYEDLQPAGPKAETQDEKAGASLPPSAPPPKRDPGSGRPTKSERRAIDRLMGRDGGKRGMVGRMVDAILGRNSDPD
jgi:ribosome-associated heat shock protein Hsp15